MRSCQYNTVTATGQVVTGPCFLIGFIVQDPAANTFLIYDATSAANLVMKVQQAAAGSIAVMFDEPVAFKTGIYYSVTGANSTACFLTA